MTTNNRQRKVSERSLANLKPFKPGQSGNPKGMPKQILTKKERLLILCEIAKHSIEKPVTAGQKIAAVREQNLMEHVYEDRDTGTQPINNFVFIMPDGTKLEPRELTRPKEIEEGSHAIQRPEEEETSEQGFNATEEEGINTRG